MDNDEAVCENIHMLMVDTGVVVDTVSSAQTAIGYLQEKMPVENTYQMLLVDWNTVNVEGIQKLKEIRALVPEIIPILLLSRTATRREWRRGTFDEECQSAHKTVFVCAFQEKILEIRAEQNHDKTEDICAVNNLEGLHFLAAEDNEINAEILREILSMEVPTVNLSKMDSWQ